MALKGMHKWEKAGNRCTREKSQGLSPLISASDVLKQEEAFSESTQCRPQCPTWVSRLFALPRTWRQALFSPEVMSLTSGWGTATQYELWMKLKCIGLVSMSYYLSYWWPLRSRDRIFSGHLLTQHPPKGLCWKTFDTSFNLTLTIVQNAERIVLAREIGKEFSWRPLWKIHFLKILIQFALILNK